MTRTLRAEARDKEEEINLSLIKQCHTCISPLFTYMKDLCVLDNLICVMNIYTNVSILIPVL